MTSETKTELEQYYCAYENYDTDQPGEDGPPDGCLFCKGRHISSECTATLDRPLTLIREQFHKWDADKLPEPASAEPQIDHVRWEGGACRECWFCQPLNPRAPNCTIRFVSFLPLGSLRSACQIGLGQTGCPCFMPADYVTELARS